MAKRAVLTQSIKGGKTMLKRSGIVVSLVVALTIVGVAVAAPPADGGNTVRLDRTTTWTAPPGVRVVSVERKTIHVTGCCATFDFEIVRATLETNKSLLTPLHGISGLYKDGAWAVQSSGLFTKGYCGHRPWGIEFDQPYRFVVEWTKDSWGYHGPELKYTDVAFQ